MPTQTRNLTKKQALSALLSFFMLCGLGGGLLAAMAIPVAATSGTAINAVTKIFDDLPTEIDFTTPSQASVILAADGSKLASFYSENRIVVGPEGISQFIKDAAVSIKKISVSTSTTALTRKASWAPRSRISPAASSQVVPRSPNST